MASGVLTPAGGVVACPGAPPPPRPPSPVVRVRGRSAPARITCSRPRNAGQRTDATSGGEHKKKASVYKDLELCVRALCESPGPSPVRGRRNGALVAEAEMDLELEEGASGDGGRGGGGGRVLVAAPGGDSLRGPRGPLFTLPVHRKREDEEEARNDGDGGDGLLHLGFALDTEDMDRSDCRPRTSIHTKKKVTRD